MEVKCIDCGLLPQQLRTYVILAHDFGYTNATEFVISEEGTYNKQNGHFLCDECYIKAGCPASPGGWKAP